ncbi:proline-rich protein [Moniliophthora roreri MCA 2997]|uniref:Proline-rich protein n=2 Tax=Moniliophthora roreri TaxID=221103 RepID=V2WTJ1_MONRO|nr:proline-rich protein [Moniliophthora roreri MCA 2997]KAI3616437.1 proline-rich protein [Moniliophthora roreri]
MKASIAVSLLMLGLATNARRFVHRSGPTSPPACVAKQQGTVDSNSTLPVSEPPVVDTGDNATTSVSVDVPINSTSIVLNDGSVASATPSFVSGLSAPPAAPTGVDAGESDNSTSNATLSKRIAQFDLPDVALAWQKLCLNSGGDIFSFDSPCVSLGGFRGIDALLANADPCAQQDVADAMITFAKSPGVINSDDLIAFAIAYRKHPRNAINILGITPATPYCLRAPLHKELLGVVNGQLEGVEPGLYGGPNFPIVPFGSEGTCPFGTVPDVATCSCVADETASKELPPVLNGTDTSIATATATATEDLPPVLNGTDTSIAIATATANDDVPPESSVAAKATGTVDFSATVTAAKGAATESVVSDDAGNVTAVESSVNTDVASSTIADDAAVTTAAAPPATISIEGFSGNINDPNGRR